ncbi:host specificity factor TipJ family phage tail protein [Serratia liquefaciens]|uniref:host specificity factor TipJ family phage tail protein n=1 Tax=Serratia liquefaciens TaxID=614 RepID=UPI0039B0230A
MTIRIYPSRLPGEPLETHEHSAMTLHQWFVDNVTDYKNEMRQPVAVEVNGKSVSSDEWTLCHISYETDVRIYPIPYATGAVVAAWTAVAVAVASAAYSLIMMSRMNKDGMGSANGGDSLDLSPAKANTAKLGDPIREVLGRDRVFPDYLVQPVSRFDGSNPQIYRTEMFLCIGVGNFAINQSTIKIGNTPVGSFGEDVSYTIYPPGADVGGDPRSENWYASTEVGGTTSGTAGLDLASTGPDSVSITADAISVSGNALSVIGAGSDTGDAVIPDSWVVGTDLTIQAPDTFTIAIEAGRNVIYGDFSELNPSVGLPISMTWNGTRIDLFISVYDPGSPAVPGVGGNAASITASAAPTTYDFSTTPLSFTLAWAGISYVISLTANYVTMEGLTEEIEDQLSGSGLDVTAVDTKIVIREKESPFSGNSIGFSVLPSVLFGSSPIVIAGTASTGGTPAVSEHISLSWGSAVGDAFVGIPTGSQRLALGLKGYRYRITDIDGQTINVERLTENSDGSTTVDPSWPGFTGRTLLDATVTGLNDDYDWMGPFLCCPQNEKTTQIELNFVYPQGLCDVGSKDGAIHWHDVAMTLQYRLSGSDDWTSVQIQHGNNTVNEVGYTEKVTFPVLGNYEVRMKRDTPVWGGTTRDSVQWQAMRAKLAARKTNYRDITTIGLTIRTGNRLAAQSDRRINMVATRLYDGHTSRSISGAFYHVLKDLGYTDNQIDYAAINSLENTYWTPRGETFDWSAGSDNTSALEVLQRIANAGMGYFLLSDGLASAGREGIKNWSGVISPQEQTEDLQTGFKALSQDDYDGVDVTYINATTWAEETIQCRLSNNTTPAKVEDYTLDGVQDPDRAYRIGMRRLMKYIHQRLTHSTSTEMDALCYNFGDRIVLTDDIPGSKTISCLVVDEQHDANRVRIQVSEPLDWSFENPRCLLRFQDGSASVLLVPERIDDYTFSVANTADVRLDEWIMNDSAVEPPRVVFCSSNRVGYDAIMDVIDPGDDGTCQVKALQYTPLLYQYDDANYPGDVQ